MVSYQKFAAELVSKGIDKSIVDKLIEEYGTLKQEHLIGDSEKVILHAAKFSDVAMALVKNKVTGSTININNIHFDSLYNEIVNYPKKTPEQVILTLAIPRVALSIQTIRNKKNVAHIKTIDPCFLDSYYCVSSCDWILSELAMLLYTSDPNEAKELIDSFVKKKVPLVEEFEKQSIVILKKDATLFDKILLTMYYFYPQRLSNSFLYKQLKSKNIYVTLRKLEDERLIHRNDKGNKLTQLGIEHVENTIIKQAQ
ncbi:MAG: hypothetical protein QW445_01685 [Candidatus Bathyarchaeia archaeon]